MCHTDTYVMGRTVNRVQEGGIEYLEKLQKNSIYISSICKYNNTYNVQLGGFYTFVDEKTCLVNVNNQYFYIKNWLFIIYSKSYVDKEIYSNP